MGEAGRTARGNRLQISVAGQGDGASVELCEQAREVGSLIAERGHILVCGGYGGVMEAAAKGAQENGGLTIGILTSYDRQDGSPYIDIRIPTGMGHARNMIVAASGDVLIAIGGECGTLSEIALARKIGRPVVALQSWRATTGLGSELDLIIASTPKEAVEFAVAYRGTSGLF